MARRTPWLAAATMLLVATAACSEPERVFCPAVLYADTMIIDDVDHVLPLSYTVGGTVCSGDLCTDVRPTTLSSRHHAVSFELTGDGTGTGADTDQIRYDLTAYDDAGGVVRRMKGASALSSAYPDGARCARPRTTTIRP